MQNGRVTLTCDGDPGNNLWFHITETRNISIIRGTSRYRESGNLLEINIPKDNMSVKLMTAFGQLDVCLC